MDICLLSSDEVARLLNYDIQPNPCSQHHHISFNRAVLRLSQDTLEVITNPSTGQQYAHEPIMYTVARKKSGNVSVVQRVRGIPYKHITPAKMAKLD